MNITCYNIHKGMDSKNKLTLEKIVRYLKKQSYDVICLQEVLYSQFLFMKNLLDMDGIFVANVVRPNLNYGICIFSKEDIQFSQHILLPSKKEQRGFVCVTININDNEKVNIINTHLGLDKEEREEQIDTILNYIDELSGKIILCGDFNSKNIIISNLIDCAVYMQKDNLPTFRTSRIDYIFCSEDCIPQNYFVNVINLSDHFPINADISL